MSKTKKRILAAFFVAVIGLYAGAFGVGFGIGYAEAHVRDHSPTFVGVAVIGSGAAVLVGMFCAMFSMWLVGKPARCEKGDGTSPDWCVTHRRSLWTCIAQAPEVIA